jgi:hypothetical protein
MIMCAWTPGPETLPGRLELDQSRGKLKLDTQHELEIILFFTKKSTCRKRSSSTPEF